MSLQDRDRWDAKYNGLQTRPAGPPDEWLRRHAGQLSPGRSLDLACGLGHNSIWLAQLGWGVDAVDISPIGLSVAAQIAELSGCTSVTWIAADLDTFRPDEAQYDLVIVFRFLDRKLPPLVERSLRPGGLLVYETFSQAQLTREGSHIRSPQFTLAPGELPSLFPNLVVVETEEVELPDRSVSRLAARKP